MLKVDSYFPVYGQDFQDEALLESTTMSFTVVGLAQKEFFRPTVNQEYVDLQHKKLWGSLSCLWICEPDVNKLHCRQCDREKRSMCWFRENKAASRKHTFP